MKRISSSSDSPPALITISTTTEDQNLQSLQKVVFGGELQSMMEGYIDEEEAFLMGGGQKKRRLSVDQVKALEKSFDLENKLEPERKQKLAQELGLQPRQVAVWFQNRRARWKNKVLEKDFGSLKLQYDELKINLDSLQNDNDTLLKEIRRLKTKLDEKSESMNVGEKGLVSELVNPPTELPTTNITMITAEGQASSMEGLEAKKQGSKAMDLVKDVDPCDSESSAILNNLDSPKIAAAAGFGGEASVLPAADANANAALIQNSNNYENGAGFEFLNLSDSGVGYYNQYQVKTEEHNFLSGNFFAEVDQLAPNLHWYNHPENWN